MRMQKEITNALIKTLIKTMAFANPSGKQNTFAAHSLPSAILIECKDVNIPVSYINGYEEAAYASREGGLISNSIRKLAREVQKFRKDMVCLFVRGSGSTRKGLLLS